jgi:arylsulfatase A-like enzyme
MRTGGSRRWSVALGTLVAALALRAPVSLAADAGATAHGRQPSLVFLLLDTTRADRFGAWGNPRATTPHLDALARTGARFARHFANAHATRSSMPQLMSGRYHHPNILRPLHSLSHPREYPFLAPDPGAVLLPHVLQAAGYRTLGVSAHPWVVAESAFGRGFHRLDFLPPEAGRGHVDARAVVDRALALWRDRPRDRPTLLYVHLMDLHMPRWLPPGAAGFADAFEWAGRFSAGSKPLFGRERRRWDQADAHDFEPQDREIFTAFYDTVLAYTDAEIARLLDEIRREDPALAAVAVVVVADHGEELGEEGRTDHTDSLADGVQHIPFIVAGAGTHPGQRFGHFSENVDVVPTILRLLGMEAAAPAGAGTFDGRPLLERDGRLCAACGRAAVHYAWVGYEAIRSRTALLRLAPAADGDAVCEGERRLWALRGARRRPREISGAAEQAAERLARRLRGRLGRRAARVAAGAWGPADRSFFVPARYWIVEPGTPLACPRIDAGTRAGALTAAAGWQYARGGYFVMRRGGGAALAVTVAAPDGDYDVDVGIVDLGRPPWMFGFDRWSWRGFRSDDAEAFVPLGRFTASERRLRVELTEDLGLGQRLVRLRLTPPRATPATRDSPELDAAPDYRERLRALGYVE